MSLPGRPDRPRAWARNRFKDRTRRFHRGPANGPEWAQLRRGLPVVGMPTDGRTPVTHEDWLGLRDGKRTAIHSEGSCYSLTSSARARIDGGTVRPSALAVLRLTTSSNLVGGSTGKSAGLAPLRIFPA